MGFLPGKLSPFAAILSVAALATLGQLASPASSEILMARANSSGQTAVISDLRIGTHPDKTRIVLDVSQPTDLSYNVAEDGKTLRLNLPQATWQVENSAARYIGGHITGFSRADAATGAAFVLKSDTAIRIKRPFFVSPGGERGHRIVIDLVATPLRHARGLADKVATSMVASLDNSGALPRAKVEVAQNSGSQNPYIQRAFPQGTQRPPQPAPRQMAPRNNPGQNPRQNPGQNPRSAMPYQQSNGFLGLPNVYARGTLGLHMASEISNIGANDDYDTEFNPGFFLSGALGTGLDNGLRIEGEMFYSNATVKQISGTESGSVYNTEIVGGDMSALAFMGNAIYDFPNNSRLTPYAMGGVGMAAIFLNEIEAQEDPIADDMDWVFAMQLGVGVSFTLDNRTNIELGYRYFETQDPEFSNAYGVPFKSVYASHNLLIGARVDLN